MSFTDIFSEKLNEKKISEKFSEIQEEIDIEDIEDIEDINSEDVDSEDLHDLIDYLDPADYGDIADLILDFLDANYEDDEMSDDPEEVNGEIEEGVSRKFTGKKKGVRKFKKTGAQLRKDKVKNKKSNRKNRVKNRQYNKKNKAKKKAYNKSYSKAVKSGQHKAKLRKG